MKNMANESSLFHTVDVGILNGFDFKLSVITVVNGRINIRAKYKDVYIHLSPINNYGKMRLSKRVS